MLKKILKKIIYRIRGEYTIAQLREMGELAGYIGTITSKPPTPLLLMKQKGGDTKVVN